MSGKVYLVGAGPGDVGLATLKAIDCISRADVILFDNLINQRLLSCAKQDAEKIDVGKEGSHHKLEQDEINKLLHKKALKNKVVVRLKGGDPFLFGRGGEEAEYLIRRGIAFEVVPGVTAGIAATAYAGIPVTHRDSASYVTFVTGHSSDDKGKNSIRWDTLPRDGTLVIYMGVKNLRHIVSNLLNAGWDSSTPTAMIEWGTLPRQRSIYSSLEDIVDTAKCGGINPPAIVVIGKVVRLHKSLGWFERKPLFGKKIVVTRSRQQAGLLTKRLEELGADVIEMPTIDIREPSNWSKVDSAIRNIKKYNWLIFTSVNGVDRFIYRMEYLGFDLRDFGSIKICSIGPATEERLKAYHLSADVTADEFTSEGLVYRIKGLDLRGKRFLYPRADIGRDVIVEELTKLGASVECVSVYKIAKPSPKMRLNGIYSADILTFASSQTVRNFVSVIGRGGARRMAKRSKIACIGPITADTVKEEFGRKADIVAKRYTIPDLVDSIVKNV